MIVEDKKNFLHKLTWKESVKGKWYLDKREQQAENKELQKNEDFDILEFEMGGYDAEKDETRQIKANDFVFSEMGKFKINKIEEGQAFLQMDDNEVPVPLTSVKKYIHVDFILSTRSNSYALNQIEIDINQSFTEVLKLISDILNIVTNLMVPYVKEVKVDSYDKKINTFDIKEGDKILIVIKESAEYIFKRTTSKDYSMSDQKHFTCFTVDKPIVVTAFAFFRNYDPSPAVYDLSVFEMTEEGAKIPVSVLTNIRINQNEVDSFYIKKVSIPEFEVKPHIKYFCYVHYKVTDMKTYYFTSGSESNDFEGVKFKFHEVSEPGYRCSKNSGHLPYFYFRHNVTLKD